MSNVYNSIMQGLAEAVEDTKNNNLSRHLVIGDDLSDKEFDAMMDKGLVQVREDESVSVSGAIRVIKDDKSNSGNI